jgi:hypothetical protein
MEVLEDAVAKGFGAWMEFHQNLFFRPLWDYPPFQEFVRPKG